MKESQPQWLAAYLYYAEPWDELLINAVRPFVNEMMHSKLADQFFFIRYWEMGPHIRLRFKGFPEKLNHEIRPRLIKHFENYYNSNPSQRIDPEWTRNLPLDQKWFPNNSIQFIDYEPEVERYGGPHGILIAEEQFELSSRVILNVLNESKAWDYQRALGAAIQLHLAFASAFNMTSAEAADFYSDIFKGWFASAYGYSPDLSEDEIKQRQETTLKAFDEQFTSQKDMLTHFHRMIWDALNQEIEFEQEWMNQWLAGMKTLAGTLSIIQTEGKLLFPDWSKPNPKLTTHPDRQKIWSIIGSYVHMTNNRLGILNRDEAFLGYIIKECLSNIE